MARQEIQMKAGNEGQTRYWLEHWTERSISNHYFLDFSPCLPRKGISYSRHVTAYFYGEGISLIEQRTSLVGDLYLAIGHVVYIANMWDVRIWYFVKSPTFSISNFVLQVNQKLDEENPHDKHGRKKLS